MEEIHERECSVQIGSQSLATMALRTGYYWLKLWVDVIKIVTKCDKH